MVSRMDMAPGDIISYWEMCAAEAMSLQQGMNFQAGAGRVSVVLMSTRKGAPYADRVEENGRVLIYEGHNIPRREGGPDPRSVDQVAETPDGRLTENGKFLRAALSEGPREQVRVYEKVRQSIWVYFGLFDLVDAWSEQSGDRKVFKFRLEVSSTPSPEAPDTPNELPHTRVIPRDVIEEVWKRDRGRCTKCGSATNLHLDHIIPFSKGGSSLTADNIQLLCMSHNLEKRDKIGY